MLTLFLISFRSSLSFFASLTETFVHSLRWIALFTFVFQFGLQSLIDNMYRIQTASILTALLSATRVAAHGHVTNIVVNGVYYQGFDIGSFPYMSILPL